MIEIVVLVASEQFGQFCDTKVVCFVFFCPPLSLSLNMFVIVLERECLCSCVQIEGEERTSLPKKPTVSKVH